MSSGPYKKVHGSSESVDFSLPNKSSPEHDDTLASQKLVTESQDLPLPPPDFHTLDSAQLLKLSTGNRGQEAQPIGGCNHITSNSHPDSIHNLKHLSITQLHKAITEEDCKKIQKLLEHGVDPNGLYPNPEAKDSDGTLSPVHRVVQRGLIEGLKYLQAQSADVNVRDSNDCTLLRLASELGSVEIIEVLLDAGSDVNAISCSKWGALHIAAQGGKSEACEALIKAGADMNMQNQHGDTPLHLAIFAGHDFTASVLISSGANLDIQNNKRLTPLILAVQRAVTLTVSFLLKEGANTQLSDTSGYFPLHYAACHASPSMVLKLMEHNCQIDCRDNAGATPFTHAAIN